MTGLRWGILGTGGIAHLFTSDLKLEGFNVTAVGSRSQASADEFAAAHGIGRAHASYEALVADPEVDVVYVSTPHPFHAENATLALEAGKHVLVEKPFTINATEAQAVVDLAAERGLVVLEAMWTRWLPHMVRVHEIIASGVLGEVRTVLADHDQKLSSDPNHRMQAPSLGGGALNKAAVIGTEGRIEIDPVWYTPTSFTVYDSSDTVIERYESSVQGRGMQFQASALEAIVAAGMLSGTELSPDETVAIVGTLDEIRNQIGLRYPNE
jgi:hypothetical protein